MMLMTQSCTPPEPPHTDNVVLMFGASQCRGHGVPSDLPTSPVNLQLPQNDVPFTELGVDTNWTTLRPTATYFGTEITMGRALADAGYFPVITTYNAASTTNADTYVAGDPHSGLFDVSDLPNGPDKPPLTIGDSGSCRATDRGSSAVKENLRVTPGARSSAVLSWHRESHS